jgi:hypothetical protein
MLQRRLHVPRLCNHTEQRPKHERWQVRQVRQVAGDEAGEAGEAGEAEDGASSADSLVLAVLDFLLTMRSTGY